MQIFRDEFDCELDVKTDEDESRPMTRKELKDRVMKVVSRINKSYLLSYRIVSYRIVSYRIVSYRIVSYRIVFQLSATWTRVRSANHGDNDYSFTLLDGFKVFLENLFFGNFLCLYCLCRNSCAINVEVDVNVILGLTIGVW